MPFVLIGSVDGTGRASIYVPYDGVASVPLMPSASASAEPRRVELDGSIVLDDSPGPERVFALLSERPLAAVAVREALLGVASGGAASIRDTVSLSLPAPILADAGSVVQKSILMEKVTR